MTRPAVEDELAITELFARYYRALDTGDTEGYLDCYTVDGEAVEESEARGIEICKGREEIRTLVLKFHDRPDFPGHQHRFSNLIFNDLGDGRWEVLSYAMSTIFHLGEPPVLNWCGHINDVVAKENGAWKIARKEILPWAGKVLERFASR
ncbi:MAG: nuclear transport factor 2 family protein [Alteraurantiacibacter sp.]